MKIRSITYFLNPRWPLDPQALQQAGAFIAAARPAIQAAGYEVQTVRLATIPFPQLLPALEPDQIIQLAQQIEQDGQAMGFDYISLGPALPEIPHSYSLVLPAIAATQNVFLSGMLTAPGQGVSLPAVRACAQIIHQAASLSPDGFANLRFAALANVPPGAPFFPAAYHAGESASFALATEAADLAVDAFSRGLSLEDARQELIRSVENHAYALTTVCQSLAQQFGVAFGGLDFTLAPFPDEALSFGTAIERLGAPAAGLHGSLAAAAILADTLDRAQYPRAGFNGLMLPVLEDYTLAKRAAEGHLTVKDLLLYSAVCGTGLDTLPLPGDTSVEQLNAVLLDLAALSQRLGKPLTARLMPIPGKQAGDPTGFDFAYFANSRVLALEAQALHGPLAGQEIFNLKPRQ
jgi:uncharacterized protein (UPF0210 family)